MSQATIYILVVMVAYLGGVLAIGYYCSKQSSSAAEFYLGGRCLGPYVTAMSAEASDMSSYLMMGLPGLAHLSGVADVGWTIIGLAVGTYLSWLLVARRLRRYSHIVDATTLPQFFSERFHDRNNILCAISAVVIIIFFIPYTASGFAGCGKLFSSIFEMDYTTAMVVSAIIIVGYTAMGGFLAASFTDFIQSIVMTTALFAVLIFAFITAGGPDAVFDNVRSLPGYLSFTETYIEKTAGSQPYTFLDIIATLSWGLGYFGMPHFLLRYMAIKEEKKLYVSRRVASVWVTCSMTVVVLIGIAGRTLSANGSIAVLNGSATETVLVRIADLIASYGTLHAALAGIILTGILASVMSTADSQLLAAASSVSQNLMQETFHMKLSERVGMIAARVTVLIIAVLGVFLAGDPDSSVFGIVSFAWAGFGGAFGPVMICCLFWKRATLQGAVAGMSAGGIMIFIWKFIIKPCGGVWGIYELLPAFMTGLIIMVLVSIMTEKPSEEIEKEFDLAGSEEELVQK
ncbi:MAG: sodium/proline symporter [Phascolarctobacterium sp.]|nr:sodium/proline symporter [Phascolarctobacterium sp.]